MSGRFVYKLFSEICVDDDFFKSLKNDYPGTDNSTNFSEWFAKKSRAGEKALIYESEVGIAAFLYLKIESEPINLADDVRLPAKQRLKIGTLKIAEDYQGQRIGEGAVGLALWRWQREKVDEIYATIFPKHDALVNLLFRFGFKNEGMNPDGECIYLRNRNIVSYADSYSSFPFINPKFKEAGYVIVDDIYHDVLFPYSELKNVTSSSVELSAANGLSKVYVGASPKIEYSIGEPVLIYRRFTGEGSKRHKSCLTSFCMVTKIIRVKERGRALLSLDELLAKIGNKSVFDRNELERQFSNNWNMNVFELLYYGFFGAGNNVTNAWLVDNGLWSGPNSYPTSRKLNPDEFKTIIRKGRLDVQNIIID